MSSPRPVPVAQHIEAAKRLLEDFEQRAQVAVDALDAGDHGTFAEAVEERDRILAELTQVVETLSHARAAVTAESEAGELLQEVQEAAASAFASQEALVRRTQQERDRLGAVVKKAKRPDNIANQYAAATAAPRPATISVTG